MSEKNHLSNTVLDKVFRLNREISDKLHEIAQIPKLPYYKLFYRTELIEQDVKARKEELKDLLNSKIAVIDTLIQKAEMEKVSINQKLRKLNLEINSQSDGVIYQ